VELVFLCQKNDETKEQKRKQIWHFLSSWK
jgi:hypothetical protein